MSWELDNSFAGESQERWLRRVTNERVAAIRRAATESARVKQATAHQRTRGGAAPLTDDGLRRLWIVATALGAAIGFALNVAIVRWGAGPAAGGLGDLLLRGAVSGAALGLAQAFVLRVALPRVPALPFLVATIAGTAAGFVMVAFGPIHAARSALGGDVFAGALAPTLLFHLLSTATITVVRGAAQATVLRRVAPPRLLALWIGAAMVGGTVDALSGTFVWRWLADNGLLADPTRADLLAVLLKGASAAVGGAVSGLVLLRMRHTA